MTNDHAQLVSAIDRLIETWNRNRMDEMEPLWDRDDPSPFYLAEEEPGPATTWAAVHDYWRRTQRLNEKIVLEISDLQVKLTGNDCAIVLYKLFWQIKLGSYPRALAGDSRVLVGLRRKDGDWRIHTYMEGALSPIAYVRNLYEGRVRPGF